MSNIYKYTAMLLLPLMAMLPACTDEMPDVAPGDGGDVQVSASVKGLAASRAPEEAGDGIIYVTRGSYTWTLDSEHCYPCVFTDGVGRIYANGSSVPLQWTVFTHDGPFRFYLDNVTETANEKLDFNEKGNATFIGPVWTPGEKTRYRAGRDTGEGENLADCDIVWGSTIAEKKKTASFDLTHRMSRVSVVLFDTDEYSSKNITVRLTGLVLEPAAFNRLTGEVMLTAPTDGAPDPVREDLVLLDNARLTPGTAEDGSAIGITPSFILPPQSTRFGDDRCFLKVTIDGTTYSAPVPELMIHTPANVSEDTWFRQGLHVEIRAHIVTDEEKPRIEFGPVYVKDWDYVGDRVATGLPGGISGMDDLSELISLYNSMPDWTGHASRLENYIDLELLKNEAYSDIFRNLTYYGRHTYVKEGYEGKMYWDFKLRNDIVISSKDLEKFRFDHYFNNWYPFNIDFGEYKMIIDGVEYTSFDDNVKRLLIDMRSGIEELQNIALLYNRLIDLGGKYLGNLTDYAPQDVYEYFKWNTEYNELLQAGATAQWVQEEGRLHWTFRLTQDIDFTGMEFEKFRQSFYYSWYPFTIDFNGFTITDGSNVYTSFDEMNRNLVVDVIDETDRFINIINYYNQLSRLGELGLGDLTQYPSKAVLDWFFNQDPAYVELVYRGVISTWINSAGQLNLTIILNDDITLPAGTPKFSSEYFSKWYPLYIDFNGHTLTVGSQTFATWEDAKGQLLTP